MYHVYKNEYIHTHLSSAFSNISPAPENNNQSVRAVEYTDYISGEA